MNKKEKAMNELILDIGGEMANWVNGQSCNTAMHNIFNLLTVDSLNKRGLSDVGFDVESPPEEQ